MIDEVESEIVVAGNEVTFFSEIEGENSGKAVEEFQTVVQAHYEIALNAWHVEAAANQPLSLYYAFHAEELGADAVGASQKDMLSKLKLSSVWLSDDEENKDGWIAHFDFSIAPEETDYLLTAALRSDGSIVELDMES